MDRYTLIMLIIGALVALAWIVAGREDRPS